MVVSHIRKLDANHFAPNHHAGVQAHRSKSDSLRQLIEGVLHNSPLCPSPTREGWTSEDEGKGGKVQLTGAGTDWVLVVVRQ